MRLLQSFQPFAAPALALAALFIVAGPVARAEVVHTGHLELELIAEAPAQPGKTVLVGLRQTIQPGWHTYWRNPGDAGEATTLDWTLPKGWTAQDILWPTPERAMTGPLMNYVYSGGVTLPVRLKVAADAATGSSVTLKAHASLLVCKDVCVPEEADLVLNLPVGSGETTGAAALHGALAAQPKPLAAKAEYSARGDQVDLAVTSGRLAAEARRAGAGALYFYPYSGTVIDHAKPQAVTITGDVVKISLPAGYDFQHAKAPARLDGIIAVGSANAYVVSATGAPAVAPQTSDQAPAITSAASPAVIPVPPAATATKAGAALAPSVSGGGAAGPPAPGLTLFSAALFAFLGGLLLNLMPCVFPVLSIKAAALARHTEHPKEARTEGLAYLGGAVASFIALALVLILARRAGQAVGWGFQLQDPLTVSILSLVMLGSALNLSGVFEMGLSAQGAGTSLTTRPGAVGAFFTGVLAVVVAAPCTGPFMATTIGWALSQPDFAALSVFAFLGAGLAAPFVALAFAPGLHRLMPKPGAWMQGLRKTLAFPMYGAAAWLAWVFAEQTNAHGLPVLFAAAILAAFGLWLWGVAQSAATDSLRRNGHLGGGAALALALAVLVLVPIPKPVAGTASAETGAWSPEKVAALQAAGKPVFVDFTAAWCVTCKVNEAGALAAPEVKAAFARTGTVYLKADWTSRDGLIAKALQEQGRAGVPLYLVYGRAGGKPVLLPQLLNAGDVVAALDRAAR